MQKWWHKYQMYLAWGLVLFCLGYGIGGWVWSKYRLPYGNSSESTLIVDDIKPEENVTSTPIVRDFSAKNVLSFKPSENLGQKVEGTSVLVTGDILLARTVNATMDKSMDYNWPFAKTANYLANADITFINLETPLTSNCPVKTDGMVFCGSTAASTGLVTAGVDVANFANNHAGNQGGAGIVSTISALSNAGIGVAGVGEPVIIEKNGKKFGFLGFNDVAPRTAGIYWADIDEVKQQIWTLRPKVDFVIVQFHWGVEYTNRPTQQQKNLAHTAIDAGADLVVGNHPHWVQGVEEYKDKFIAYSHGNFIFDQQWSQATTEGVVGRYIFGDKNLIAVEYYPIIVDKTLQTRWADEKESMPIFNRMLEGSK